MLILVLLNKFGREPDVLHIWDWLSWLLCDTDPQPKGCMYIFCGNLLFNEGKQNRSYYCCFSITTYFDICYIFHFPVVILDVSATTSISAFLMFSFSEMQILIFKSSTKIQKLQCHISDCWLSDNK